MVMIMEKLGGPARGETKFDTDDAEATKQVREEFDSLIKSGYTAYQDGEKVTELPQTGEKVELLYRLVGG